MAWLPFERYVLTSPLSAAQLTQKLAEDAVADDYLATINNNVATIEPSARFKIGGYSQAFKPGAVVRIADAQQGAKLSIVIKPKGFAVAILVLVVLLLLVGVWYSQRNNLALGNYKPAAIAGMGLLILAYMLPMTAFNADIENLKTFTGNLFEVANDK